MSALFGKVDSWPRKKTSLVGAIFVRLHARHPLEVERRSGMDRFI